MVTDEQGREWLLQKLYDNGLAYVVMDELGNTFITDKKPFDNVNEAPIGSYKKRVLISGGITIFSNVEPHKVYDIAEELGIIDWTDVKINTPILVRNFDDERWQKGHFAKYDGGRVFAFPKGRTSFTSGLDWGIAFEQAKLAEVENE